MEFLEIVMNRYSVRAFNPDPVDEAVLQKVLEAARWAPTANNRQPLQLIVIHTEGREAELRRICDRPWFIQAPHIVCACGIPAQSWTRMDGKPYTDVDAAIVMDHLILAATEAGLGTCWIAAFDPVAAREVLGLPTGVEPIIFALLGHAADQPRPKERKSLTDLVRYERW
jgi:nitroreductase